ncbi:phosphoglucomutase/phosphomannomutase family protein, partial [Candidatus Margulisiibacteriota bacterium]
MIKFGTDGWRAKISDEFTFENVRLVTQGYVNYLKKKGSANKGLVIGYDNRFQSENFAYEAAKVAASNGIKVYLTEKSVPSQVTSLSVKKKNAAGGVMITASHNPAEWNGFKIKAPYGGSAPQEITKAVEKEVQDLISKKDTPKTGTGYEKLITKFNPKKDYFDHIAKLVDFSLIKKANINIAVDPMHGSAIGYLKDILSDNGIKSEEINNNRDPLFGGINPEPLPINLEELSSYTSELSLKNSNPTVGIALPCMGST